MCEKEYIQGQVIEKGDKKFELVEFVDYGKVYGFQKILFAALPILKGKCVVDVAVELLDKSPAPVGFVGARKYAACELCQHNVTYSLKRISG